MIVNDCICCGPCVAIKRDNKKFTTEYKIRTRTAPNKYKLRDGIQAKRELKTCIDNVRVRWGKADPYIFPPLKGDV